MDYFTDEIKGNLIVEFVRLHPKMYLFTVYDASEPIPMVNYPMDIRNMAVAKGVEPSQLKRLKHENYVRMYNGGALTYVFNRRIGSSHHQVRLIILILICMTANLTICFQIYIIKKTLLLRRHAGFACRPA